MDNAYQFVSLINNFPDFNVKGFDIDTYNNFFKTSNSIINAKASDIAYPEHWGCFSIKCAFGGEEIYRSQNRVYAVHEQNFLLLNEGQYYSSYIFSKKPVESFTLNFTKAFMQEVCAGFVNSDEQILDYPLAESKINTEFVERLYKHDNTVSPVLFKIKQLAKNFYANRAAITELYFVLLEKLLLFNTEVHKEINNVKASKPSTQKELYKRLHYAKDFIDSCYASEITLHELSQITLMNTAYFLRQFKKYFHTTPYKYLMTKRMQVAGNMMQHTRLPIADICTSVGYEDVSSFTKLFKKQHGISPEKFRGQHI
ncbi:helix-turn-helix transcriptional regulator [Panacibacter ginsenosidivorans]|uniref:Helix-turn-helix transcriptional regulator n=1 Tax=Panacibacter ginsenosidivorans TaxID=1813871 RepID=A0A5B8V5M8_9BACT|nr:AraC family transcriptional regulator [Panacibacter ginsenosidivorans]QEC66123.1 helix-turn-helix transcriptional regulator [Panacibacter ginsenosidivorans]